MKLSTFTPLHLMLIFLTALPAISWRPQPPSSFNARIGNNNNFQFQRIAPTAPLTFQATAPKARPIHFNLPKPKPFSFVKPLSESYFNRGTSSFAQFSSLSSNRQGHLLKSPQSLRRPTSAQTGNSLWKSSPPKLPLKTFSTGSKIAGKFDAPGAYSWGYRWVDEAGTAMFREETADGMGTVWGRYSFREADGRLRIVEYVSDPENGFRTRIRSNEPGVVTSNPANAVIVRFDSEDELADSFDFDFAGRKNSAASAFSAVRGRSGNRLK